MAATVHRWNTYVLLSTSTQDTKMALIRYAKLITLWKKKKKYTLARDAEPPCSRVCIRLYQCF